MMMVLRQQGLSDWLPWRKNSEKTNDVLTARLEKTKNAVIPGFYGAKPNGEVKTFSRGGSDVTGSIVARAIKAYWHPT